VDDVADGVVCGGGFAALISLGAVLLGVSLRAGCAVLALIVNAWPMGVLVAAVVVVP
jgi:hypothetical protein